MTTRETSHLSNAAAILLLDKKKQEHLPKTDLLGYDGHERRDEKIQVLGGWFVCFTQSGKKSGKKLHRRISRETGGS